MTEKWSQTQRKWDLVRVTGGVRVIRVRVNRVKMTEKWGQIQGKWDLVRVSGGVRVIRVRVTAVLLYLNEPVLNIPE